MDIELLSKMVREIIRDKDEVALPGVGTFVAEIVPSVFSDKGYTINPPYRKLYFRQKEKDDDKSVIELYAKSNGIGQDASEKIVREFLSGLRATLESKKSIAFPGLGRLRATKENYFFFIADEDLDIYPEGFGLEPISLKTHEESISEVSEAMASLRSIIGPESEEIEPAHGGNEYESEESATEMMSARTEEPVYETPPMSEEEHVSEIMPKNTEKLSSETPPESTEEHTSETMSENAEEHVSGVLPTSAEERQDLVEMEKSEAPLERPKVGQEKPFGIVSIPDRYRRRRAFRIAKRAVIILVLLALAAFVIFLVMAQVAPDLIDKLLYTKEELEILRY